MHRCIRNVNIRGLHITLKSQTSCGNDHSYRSSHLLLILPWKFGGFRAQVLRLYSSRIFSLFSSFIDV